MEKKKSHRVFAIILIVVAGAAMLTACSTTADGTPDDFSLPSDREIIAWGFSDEVAIEDDEFEISATFLGPQAFVDDVGEDYYFIRSWVNKETGAIKHQIYVVVRYGGDWRFYERARAVGGSTLDFTEIDRDVDCARYGCTYTEDFGVAVSDSSLRAATESGLSFKAVARKGADVVVNVSPDLITQQLDAISSWQREN